MSVIFSRHRIVFVFLTKRGSKRKQTGWQLNLLLEIILGIFEKCKLKRNNKNALKFEVHSEKFDFHIKLTVSH